MSKISRREFIKIMTAATLVASISPAALVEGSSPKSIELVFKEIEVASDLMTVTTGGEYVRGAFCIKGHEQESSFFVSRVLSIEDLVSDIHQRKRFCRDVETAMKGHISRKKGIPVEDVFLDFNLEEILISGDKND
jgi:hypothetical protein